ncbi:MAG: flavodoxin domain-containing protein [Gaiellaceae bacterium]
MKKALVVCHSRTGTTIQLAEEIRRFLENNSVAVKVVSIEEFSPADLEGTDYLMLGCWTSGAIFVLQHPERIWIAFARRLPDLTGKKIGLFTTYTIATGSMFRGMRRRLSCDPADIRLELKSRDGKLSGSHRAALDRFVRD